MRIRVYRHQIRECASSLCKWARQNKNAGISTSTDAEGPEKGKRILLIQAAGMVRDEAVNKAWSLQGGVDEQQISVGLHRGAEMTFS